MNRTFATRKIRTPLIASTALALFVPGLATAQQSVQHAVPGLRDTASLFAGFGDVGGGPVKVLIAGQGGAVAETVLSQTATNVMTTAPSGLNPAASGAGDLVLSGDAMNRLRMNQTNINTAANATQQGAVTISISFGTPRNR